MQSTILLLLRLHAVVVGVTRLMADAIDRRVKQSQRARKPQQYRGSEDQASVTQFEESGDELGLRLGVGRLV